MPSRIKYVDGRRLLEVMSVILVCLVGGCRMNQSAPGSDSTESSPEPISTGSFTGLLPCASCPGIETVIEFASDHTYRRRRTYLGTPDSLRSSFFDFGRWSESVGGRIILRSMEGDATRFVATGPEEIRMLDMQGDPIDSGANHSLNLGPRKEAAFGPASMVGMYTYFADAAIFRPCNTETTFPVAMVDQHVDLEKLYLANRAGPGAPLLVRVDASLEDHPIGEGDTMRESVAVQGVGDVYPGRSCLAGPLLTDSLGWRLVELDGIPVTELDSTAVPTLTFGDDSVTGSTGCNRLSGPVQVGQNELRLGPLATTRRACPQDLEGRFLNLLSTVDGYKMYGHRLELLSGDLLVAVFVSRQFVPPIRGS